MCSKTTGPEGEKTRNTPSAYGGVAIFRFAILFLHDCNTLRGTFLAAVVAPVVAWHPCSDKEAS